MRALMIPWALLAALPQAAAVQAGPSAATPTRATPGTVVIVPEDSDQVDPETIHAFADAVGQSLLNARFTPIPGQGHSRYIARIRIVRAVRGLATAPVARGEPSMVGAAVAIPLSGGKKTLQGLIVSELRIHLILRSSMQTVWSGTATTAQAEESGANSPPVVARKLADVLVSGFPVTHDQAISVP